MESGDTWKHLETVETHGDTWRHLETVETHGETWRQWRHLKTPGDSGDARRRLATAGDSCCGGKSLEVKTLHTSDSYHEHMRRCTELFAHIISLKRTL